MSNPVGQQSSYPIEEAQEQSGRRIRENGVVINEADLMELVSINIQSLTDANALEIAKGNVDGTTFINKFGDNPIVPVTGADIWEFGGFYTFSTAADIDTLSSSDAGDVYEVCVVGLDENWLEVTQFITLTGQAKVTLPIPLIRINRMFNNNGLDIAGIVYCYVDGLITAGVPDVDADVRAIIVGDHNQTLMCIYTVPAGKTAYFAQGYVAIAEKRAVAATMELQARLFGGVFRVQSVVALNSAGSGTWQYKYAIPNPLPEKTDVLIKCSDASATVALSGGFDIILIDN